MFFLLLITYYLLLLFLCARNLKWGIYWVIFTLPAYLIRFEVFGLPMTLLEGEVLILFLVFIIKTFYKLQVTPQSFTTEQANYKLQKDLLLYYFITLLLLAATISIFISPNLRAAFGTWKAYFIEPILFFIVFIFIIKKEDLKNIFTVFSFQILILSFFAIYQKFTGNFIPNEFWANEATRRVTSVFPYPNALALYLAPVIILLIGDLAWRIESCELSNKLLIIKGFFACSKNRPLLSSRRKSGSRIHPEYSGLKHLHMDPRFRGDDKRSKCVGYITIYLSLLTTFLSLSSIYYTKSKGALLAIAAGIVFYAIFYKGYRKIFISVLVIIFIFIFLYSCVFIPSARTSRGAVCSFDLRGESTIEGGDSISTRLEMWRETWQMLKTRPIFGAGLAGYQTAVAPFHQKDYIEIYLYPHNIFLNFWTETGILGLISFILIVVWFYRRGIRNREYGLSIILMSVMTTLLVHGLVDVPYFKNDLAVLFWILVGSNLVLNDAEESHSG